MEGLSSLFPHLIFIGLLALTLRSQAAQAEDQNYEAEINFNCKPLNLECRAGLRNIKTELFDNLFYLGPFAQDRCDKSLSFSSVSVKCMVPSTIPTPETPFRCGQVKYKIAFNPSPGSHLIMTGKVKGILRLDSEVVKEWQSSKTGNVTAYLRADAEDERFRGTQYHLWNTVWESETTDCEQAETFKTMAAVPDDDGGAGGVVVASSVIVVNLGITQLLLKMMF